MGVTVLIFSDFWERTGASFKIECMWKGEESIKKSVFQNLTSTIEVLQAEVELSNTCAAYVMHIPNTPSLTSARNNRRQKFQ